jgi:hypothetical protein
MQKNAHIMLVKLTPEEVHRVRPCKMLHPRVRGLGVWRMSRESKVGTIRART